MSSCICADQHSSTNNTTHFFRATLFLTFCVWDMPTSDSNIYVRMFYAMLRLRHMCFRFESCTNCGETMIMILDVWLLNLAKCKRHAEHRRYTQIRCFAQLDMSFCRRRQCRILVHLNIIAVIFVVNWLSSFGFQFHYSVVIYYVILFTAGYFARVGKVTLDEIKKYLNKIVINIKYEMFKIFKHNRF